MASSSVASENASTADSGQAPRTMVLHVLSPSLDAPNRLTFNDLPLTTTVAELKARISQSIPSRPSSDKQRLIYRGKPLVNDSAMLQNILEPPDDPVHSMHLVLPPAPTPSGTASAPAGSSTPVQDTPAGQTDPSRYLRGYVQPNQQLRLRGLASRPSPGPSESEIEVALRRNIEALRRQIEQQEQTRGQPQRQGSDATVSSGRSYQLPNLPTFQHFTSPFTSSAPQTPSSLAHQPTSRNTSSSTLPMADSTVSEGSAGINLNADQTTDVTDVHTTGTGGTEEVENRQLRLLQLQNNISYGESQLNRGVAPPLDSIAHIRNELYRLLDHQSINPLAPRDGRIEALLARALNLYVRADQLRVSQARSPANRQDDAANPVTTPDAAHAPIYLLSSPAGHEALIASPSGAAAIQSSMAVLRSQQAQASGPALRQDQAQGALNPGAVMMDNAVRQVLLNHRRLENNRQAAFARNLRRIWLFIRLYFFCYLFSESGTWSRVIFVSLAVLISLLSETGLPRQFQRMVIAPVQRHLEGLVHIGADEIQPVPRGGVGANLPPEAAEHAQVAAGGPDQRRTGLQQNLRRLERSLALFFASLVPGVGERHVEARNAVQAAAERARAEEEIRRRRQAEEAAEAAVEEATGAANPDEPAGGPSPHESPRVGSPELNNAEQQ
ncbi:hypothetical protein VTN00DRAFT_9244 [Thermoascus crustaceus]|uniref:uncharacterized protein n=1 Tax=Thermoascus crustaceus TaxID=5088 RepID=UPI003742153F